MYSSEGELTENPRLRDARRPRSETTASSLVAIVRAGALQAQLTGHGQDCTASTPAALYRRKRARRRKKNESAETETAAATSQRPSRNHDIAGKKMQSVVVALALSTASALVAPSRPAARGHH